MSNTPSDAEIIELMRDGYNCRYNDEADHIEFARAVLAKWGTPRPASAPLSFDLLEALQEIVEDLEQGAIPNANDPWWRKARDAITAALAAQGGKV